MTMSLFKIGTIRGNGKSIQVGQATHSDLKRYSIRLSLALPPNCRPRTAVDSIEPSPNRRMKIARSTIAGALLTMTLSVAQAEWRFDAETGGLYNSNLSNSDRSADEKDDWAWKTSLRIGNGLQLSRDLRLSLAADLHGHLWDRFD